MSDLNQTSATTEQKSTKSHMLIKNKEEVASRYSKKSNKGMIARQLKEKYALGSAMFAERSIMVNAYDARKDVQGSSKSLLDRSGQATHEKNDAANQISLDLTPVTPVSGTDFMNNVALN